MNAIQDSEMIVSQLLFVRLRTAGLALTLAVLASWACAQPTSVLLVLDASGSMFVQLDDGQYRITAAKAALTEFVTRLADDPELGVGFRVYGSRIGAREDGACQDSHLDVPVAGFDRAGLLDTIRSVQAKGATPIAYSLALAADDLRDAPGRRVVVLVTDGAESCGGDVRAAVERLTAAGLDVDLRIIGFDLDAAAIRGFEGLGTFENATSAVSLAAALGRAVDLTANTAAYPVTVTLTRRGEPATEGAAVRFVDAVDGTETTFTSSGDGAFSTSLAAGLYDAEVADAYAATPLVVGGLTISPDDSNTFAFELEPENDVALTVSSAAPAAGGLLTVRFEGAPAGDENWITVVPAGADDTVYRDWSYVSGASGEVSLRLPDTAGTLEARYHLELPVGGTQVIGRSAPFESVAVSATVTAPAEVGAGARFEVTWTGPDNDGDYVTIVPPDAPDDSYTSYVYTDGGATGSLTAPIDPGDYEVRYVTGQSGVTLIAEPIIITAVSATVTAPAEVGAGARFEVTWTGPDNDGDYVTIVPPDAPDDSYTSYVYTDGSATGGASGSLTAPIDAGDYEVRYVTGQGGLTLAATPVAVRAVDASVSAPAHVNADTPFEITWSGPDNDGDYVTIVRTGAAEGSYEDYAYTVQGNSLEIFAPEETGSYEVRYVSGQGDRTLARTPIEVR